MKKIYIASDHAGFDMKEVLVEYLSKDEYELFDLGPETSESCDYPDFAHLVSGMVCEQGIGILLCGSGNGVSMTANKWPGVRAALCWNDDLSKLARQHNNANIVCIPSRFVSTFEAKKIVDAFLSQEFEGGRHEKRIEKIDCI
jgi:ribose 5-phosphate isomerase B